MKNVQKVLGVGLFACIFSSSSFGIRYANVCDGADIVLYGSREVSPALLMKITESIEEPEMDRGRKGIKIRDEKESEKVVLVVKKALQEKINSIQAGGKVDSVSTRIMKLLELDLSYFNPVAVSYLLEKIYNEYI